MERAWVRTVSVLIVLFSLYFIVDEFDGLVRLVEWTWAGLSVAPESVRTVISYYGALPAQQLLPSLVVGAGFGMVTTTLFLLATQAVLQLPKLSTRAFWSGAAVVAVGVLLAANLLLVLALALLVMIVVAYLFQPDMRAFLSWVTLRRLSTQRGRRVLLLGLLLGAGFGAVGSQMLAYPTQHCTYAPEAVPVENQLGVIITTLGALLVLMPLWSVLLLQRSPANQSTSGYFRNRVLPYALLMPMLLNLTLFLYYPSVQTLTLSLRSRRFPLPQERFVCLGNYVNLSQDPIYQNSFLSTGAITIAIVLLSLAISLGIAVLASQKVKWSSVYRTLLIWPFALSPVVSGVIFLAMFREGGGGLINFALDSLVGIRPGWLRDPNLARWTIILASVWNILGFNILFYIAGLQNVPKDLLEAAQIDGANVVQRFARVTFPLLAPFTFFLLITNVTYSFYGIYGVVDTLTQGGPPLGPAGQAGGATDVLIFKLYEDAFNPGAPVGLAAAQAVILFALVAGLTILQFRTLETRITYGE